MRVLILALIINRFKGKYMSKLVEISKKMDKDVSSIKLFVESLDLNEILDVLYQYPESYIYLTKKYQGDIAIVNGCFDGLILNISLCDINYEELHPKQMANMFKLMRDNLKLGVNNAGVDLLKDKINKLIDFGGMSANEVKELLDLSLFLGFDNKFILKFLCVVLGQYGKYFRFNHKFDNESDNKFNDFSLNDELFCELKNNVKNPSEEYEFYPLLDYLSEEQKSSLFKEGLFKELFAKDFFSKNESLNVVDFFSIMIDFKGVGLDEAKGILFDYINREGKFYVNLNKELRVEYWDYVLNSGQRVTPINLIGLDTNENLLLDLKLESDDLLMKFSNKIMKLFSGIGFIYAKNKRDKRYMFFDGFCELYKDRFTESFLEKFINNVEGGDDLFKGVFSKNRIMDLLEKGVLMTAVSKNKNLSCSKSFAKLLFEHNLFKTFSCMDESLLRDEVFIGGLLDEYSERFIRFLLSERSSVLPSGEIVGTIGSLGFSWFFENENYMNRPSLLEVLKTLSLNDHFCLGTFLKSVDANIYALSNNIKHNGIADFNIFLSYYKLLEKEGKKKIFNFMMSHKSGVILRESKWFIPAVIDEISDDKRWIFNVLNGANELKMIDREWLLGSGGEDLLNDKQLLLNLPISNKTYNNFSCGDHNDCLVEDGLSVFDIIYDAGESIKYDEDVFSFVLEQLMAASALGARDLSFLNKPLVNSLCSDRYFDDGGVFKYIVKQVERLAPLEIYLRNAMSKSNLACIFDDFVDKNSDIKNLMGLCYALTKNNRFKMFIDGDLIKNKGFLIGFLNKDLSEYHRTGDIDRRLGYRDIYSEYLNIFGVGEKRLDESYSDSVLSNLSNPDGLTQIFEDKDYLDICFKRFDIGSLFFGLYGRFANKDSIYENYVKRLNLLQPFKVNKAYNTIYHDAQDLIMSDMMRDVSTVFFKEKPKSFRFDLDVLRKISKLLISDHINAYLCNREIKLIADESNIDRLSVAFDLIDAKEQKNELINSLGLLNKKKSIVRL